MGRSYYTDLLNDAQLASFAAVNTHTAATALWANPPSALQTVIPAGDMRAGKVYQLRAGGVMGTTATPTVAYTPVIGVNGTAADTSLGISATHTTGSGLTAVPWYADFILAVRSIGGAASLAAVVGSGFVTIGAVAAAAGLQPAISIGGLTTVTTVNDKVANAVTLCATWSASSASNTHTTHFAILNPLN